MTQRAATLAREGLRHLQEVLANPPAGFELARGYLVLVTDGMPVRKLNCEQTEGPGLAVTDAEFNELIDDVAATSASTGVETFVIGVPGSELTNQVPTVNGEPEYLPQTKLSELAQAGMTAPAGCSTTGPNYCHIDMTDPSIDFVTALTDVIGTISSSVASCAYPVPENPDPTLIVDPFNPLSVMYYAAGSTAASTLPQSVGCTDGLGWDYANSSQDTINLCPTSCSTVQADTEAQIRVSLGCVPVG